MMKVELVSYTPQARELLLWTKQTRLSQTAAALTEIMTWSEEKKTEELRLMLGTIASSWEFVNYVFAINGVSRAFTHQFVRHRHMSFAQQSQRKVDMTGAGFIMPEAMAPIWVPAVEGLVNDIQAVYDDLVADGVPPQDARCILPTNVETAIIVGANLRTLSEAAKERLCTRTQGEAQQVFRAMREAVCAVHPWAAPFIRVHCAATGVCRFPNYLECPIKPAVYNPDTGRRWDDEHVVMTEVAGHGDTRSTRIYTPPLTRDEIQVVWENTRYEAIP